MGYVLSRIQELKIELAAMPELDPAIREVNKLEAIRQLAPEIGSMQKKGYSLERVVTVLADRGIAITVGTLKTYLSRGKPRRPRQPRDDSRSTKRQQSVAPAETPQGTPAEPAVGKKNTRGVTAEGLDVDGTRTASMNGRQMPVPGDGNASITPEMTAKKVAFAVREDSDEL